MKEEKTEGLLLQSIPYLGMQKILKVLTPEKGLLSFIVKKGIFEPFCIGEWVYIEKSQGLFPLKDVSISEYFFELRKDFATLSSAGQIGRALLLSQLPGKGGGLYALGTAYLRKLPLFEDPKTLVSSFLLKLLLHDGFLALEDTCAECEKPALCLEGGESLCLHHKTEKGVVFSQDEWHLLHQLTFVRTFQNLKQMIVEKPSQEKIERLYANIYQK